MSADRIPTSVLHSSDDSGDHVMKIPNRLTRHRRRSVQILALLALGGSLVACSVPPRAATSHHAQARACCCEPMLDNPYFADDETLARCTDELVAQERSLGGVLLHADSMAGIAPPSPASCLS